MALNLRYTFYSDKSKIRSALSCLDIAVQSAPVTLYYHISFLKSYYDVIAWASILFSCKGENSTQVKENNQID